MMYGISFLERSKCATNLVVTRRGAVGYLRTSNVDILMISETRLDNSFLEGQFLIEGYSKPYGIDRNCHGGGIICKSRYSIKTSVHRAVTNGRFLCRDKPSEKEMVAMLFLQFK